MSIHEEDELGQVQSVLDAAKEVGLEAEAVWIMLKRAFDGEVKTISEACWCAHCEWDF